MTTATISHIPQRRDSLPDTHDYEDNGCSLHHRCLTCPFERCRYDYNHVSRKGEMTRSLVRELMGLNLSVDELVSRTGVSRRQVFRVLKELRNG